MKDFAVLADVLGVTFADLSLLQQAMTHRSYLNENRTYPLPHNERLEFLGDAVLELVVTDHLFHHYNRPEGELTAWRSALVNGEMLAKIGASLGLGDYLLMSRGEEKDQGRARQYLLANAVEATIGAIYIDKNLGYKAAEDFIHRTIIVHLDEVIRKKLYLDPKSYFQEQAQRHISITPHYQVLSEVGKDHQKIFVVGVFLGTEKVAEGTGFSKQDAQRDAARNALEAKGWL